MKKIAIILTVVLIAALPFSCSEQLDINTNPLSASSADPNAVLPYVIVQYSNRKTTELGTRLVDVYQHASMTPNSAKNGGSAAGGIIAGNTWGMLYTQVLSNLSNVERDARAAGATNNNVVAIAVTLKALAFLDATLIWGDVPFTQAINAGEFPQPAFDNQETVLRGVVAMLNEAMVLIDNMPATGNFNVATGDLIYSGNMANWRAYANSLKIRTLMLLLNRDASVASQITSALGEAYISSNAQAAMLRYPGTNLGSSNAWSQMVTLYGTGSNEDSEYWGPSEIMRDILEGDPRLELWCVDGTDGGYPFSNIGAYPTQDEARYSDNVIRATLPDVFFLPAEITLYRAELAAKGIVAGDVNALYRQAVTQNLQFWAQSIPGAVLTLTNAQIDAYVTSLPDLNTLTQANQLLHIGEEQYLETFLRPVEAWTTVRRTKVPAVQAAPAASITTMLKRFQYPPAERASNDNVPIDLLGDIPQWFEN